VTEFEPWVGACGRDGCDLPAVWYWEPTLAQGTTYRVDCPNCVTDEEPTRGSAA
jgi:hypothetical protein